MPILTDRILSADLFNNAGSRPVFIKALRGNLMNWPSEWANRDDDIE
jgi:hypothetical protein